MKRLIATEIRKMGVKCNKNDLGHLGFYCIDLIGINIMHAKKL